MNNSLNKFVKAILDFCFFVGIVIEISVPFILSQSVNLVVEKLGDTTEYAKILDYYPFAIVSIMLAGGAALVILYDLRRMMKTVIEDDCFVKQNVDSLYRMGTFAFIIAGIKIIRCFVYFTPAAIIVAGVFGFAGLLSKVLARVFDRAVSYKQENDLTI